MEWRETRDVDGMSFTNCIIVSIINVTSTVAIETHHLHRTNLFVIHSTCYICPLHKMASKSQTPREVCIMH